MTQARITSKGQITVPKEIRERLGVEPGDSLDFLFEQDRLEVKPIKRRKLAEFRGIFRVPKAYSFEEERARAWEERAKELTQDETDVDA